MRFVVLGAGLMGRAALYDLARSPAVAQITVADFDPERARHAARRFGNRRTRAVVADVRQTARLASLLRGCDVVLNCTQYYWNVAVMRAALRARVHYLDLGGLFHVTRKQMRLASAFRRAGRLALVGMGGAPGITNVMARFLADQLDRVEAIHVYDGTAELNPSSDPLGYTFSIATILDELTLPPVIFSNGRFRTQPLFSGEELVRFRAPLGRLSLRYSLHSEVATLPRSFRSRGVREVSFRINYDPRLIETAQLLRRLGLLNAQPLEVDAARVAPRAMLERLLKGRAVSTARVRDVEVMMVVVRGKKSGRPQRLHLDATASYALRPSLTAVARDTGFPASIAAQMIARGEIQGAGVLAPEEVVPPLPFFLELEKRGIHLSGSGWPGSA